MIHRTLTHRLRRAAGQFPVVTLTGPRQAGKTTLCRATFPDLPYANLEHPPTRDFALSDANVFVSNAVSSAFYVNAPRISSSTPSVATNDGPLGALLVDGLDVRGDPRHQPADGIAVEKRRRQTL